MLKKFFFFSLLFCAMLVFSPAALADETQTTESTYYEISGNWEYTLIHQVEVKNLAHARAFDITITVPLNDLTTPEYNHLIGMELDPYPNEIFTDGTGRRYAVYQIDSLDGGESVTLTQRYALTVSSIYYTFDRSSVPEAYSEVEQLLFADELAPAENIESDSAPILAFVEETVGSETNPYRKARSLFSAVNLLLSYDSDASADQSALAVLLRESGNCEGYTNLYIACLRAAGVPARQASGYLYLPSVHVSEAYIDTESGLFLFNKLRHTWVEYCLPDIGWVFADPTFTYTFEINGTIQKFVDWSYFSMISNARRYFFFHNGDTESDAIQITATGGAVTAGFKSYMSIGTQYVPFHDLKGHWAEDAATYCVENGLFNGVSASSFAPDGTMTRAMFVTVLGRLYEATGGEIGTHHLTVTQFTDVDFNSYYINYLGWALDSGLISGYGDGSFGPNSNVTREQMAKIICDFLSYLGYDTTADSLSFLDKRLISEWAKDGVACCVQQGVITGFPDNKFRPGDYATRGQVAAIFERLGEKLL